jgi:hypothetical protein
VSGSFTPMKSVSFEIDFAGQDNNYFAKHCGT